MNKAANIYWDDSSWTKSNRTATSRRRRQRPAAAVKDRNAPWWLSFLIVTSIFVMLCVSINFRAFSEAREEADKNTRLAGEVQNLMDENMALQEEIHTLKTDPRVIQREAKRIGMNLRQDKVSVPMN